MSRLTRSAKALVRVCRDADGCVEQGFVEASPNGGLSWFRREARRLNRSEARRLFDALLPNAEALNRFREERIESELDCILDDSRDWIAGVLDEGQKAFPKSRIGLFQDAYDAITPTAKGEHVLEDEWLDLLTLPAITAHE